MKVIAIIPARYKSTRFEGKPLADICGKPMIWWVYQQVKKVSGVDEVYVATDDSRIEDVCKNLSIKCIMTKNNHSTPTSRVSEVAEKINSDLYVVINGDEPLIDPKVIEKIIPSEIPKSKYFVSNLMSIIKDPAEVVDFTNIKVVFDCNNNALFYSRSPIPYPKGTLEYKYYKHVGVMCYNLEALRFFVSHERSHFEKIEDVDYLRFIENGVNVKMIEAEGSSLSVDTPKDLERVRNYIEQNKV